MSHSRKKRRQPGEPAPPDASAGRQGREGGSPRGGRWRKAGSTPGGARFLRQRPILRFTLIFAVCMGIYGVCSMTSFFKSTALPAYLRVNADASGFILRALGQQVSVADTHLASSKFSLTVKRGCDAVDPSALFVAGVLASPVGLWLKLPGLLIGTLLLMVLNLVRIVSLYYVGAYFPRVFETVHLDVWQAVFVFLAILFWALWALWARYTRERARDAPA